MRLLRPFGKPYPGDICKCVILKAPNPRNPPFGKQVIPESRVRELALALNRGQPVPGLSWIRLFRPMLRAEPSPKTVFRYDLDSRNCVLNWTVLLPARCHHNCCD